MLLFYDDRPKGKGKRSAISVQGNMIVIQNSIVWLNVKLTLEFIIHEFSWMNFCSIKMASVIKMDVKKISSV